MDISSTQKPPLELLTGNYQGTIHCIVTSFCGVVIHPPVDRFPHQIPGGYLCFDRLFHNRLGDFHILAVVSISFSR
jgi:hypothetical protein